MELMDDSLTHFLESSTQPIPYHIEVNICHDITLALSFLHSNGIVHRDLSGNNVLLIGNIRAKLTDFGMARLGDLNLHATRVTNTMCPGNDIYMPPEAVQDKPVYTEKIDCFSFGVITIQTLTREFPKPGDRLVTINDPRYPQGALKLCVPEIERRQNHIRQVDPNNPLLPIALDCLKDNDGERPSAQQLCERVAALIETARYKNVCERMKDNSARDGGYEQLRIRHVIDQKDATIAEKEHQLRRCREELTQQIGQQNWQIQQHQQEIEQQRQQIQQWNQEIQHLERDKRQVERERDQTVEEKHQAIQEKERQLGRVNQQLEESEQLVADFVKRNTELEEQLRVLRRQIQEKDSGAKARAGAVGKANIKLRWREGEKAPFKMYKNCDPAIGNNTMYCRRDYRIYAYHIPSSDWSLVPHCPFNNGFTITVIDGLLTTVGGFGSYGDVTNKLFSLTGEGSGRRWTEKFPPMPTKCFCVAALCTGAALIVAGGFGERSEVLKTVEVLNTETGQWHTAASLPGPMSESSLVLCGDLVYLQEGFHTYSVYSCSLISLLSSTGFKVYPGVPRVSTLTRSSKDSIWNRVADLPVKGFTAVSLYGQLLAIGGDKSDNPVCKWTTAIHMYQPTTNSWEVISHMTVPRERCLAAVLPDNQVMVVGGLTTGSFDICNSVEFGKLLY